MGIWRLLRQLPPWLLLLLCALYVVSPVDLLPDFFGLPGRLDDLLVALGALFYLYSTSRKASGVGGTRRDRSPRGEGGGRREQGKSDGAFSSEPPPGPQSPYEILGVDPGADLAEIRRRYREKLLQYHPDRVQHLGTEFQEMAERKTREITEAFQKILRERGNRS
jgi:hypothetical protein